MIFEILKRKTVEGREIETVYVDGKNIREVLEGIESYQEEYYATDNLYGTHEDEFILRITDDNDNESEVTVVIRCHVEKPIDHQREYGTWNKSMQGRAY